MSCRILLVDDNQDLLESLTLLLRDEGHRVHAAGTLEAARRYLLDGAADLMLLDVRLPDGDGLAFYREARILRPDMPIMVMTGFRPEQILADCCALSVSFAPDRSLPALQEVRVITEPALFKGLLRDLLLAGRVLHELADLGDLDAPISQDTDCIVLRGDQSMIEMFVMVRRLRDIVPSASYLLAPVREDDPEHGMWSDCLFKPFDMGQFLTRVGQLLASRCNCIDKDEVVA